jgi:hypothetical protein
LLDDIQEKLCVENHAASELADLDDRNQAGGVLAPMTRLQNSALHNRTGKPDRRKGTDRALSFDR